MESLMFCATYFFIPPMFGSGGGSLNGFDSGRSKGLSLISCSTHPIVLLRPFSVLDSTSVDPSHPTPSNSFSRFLPMGDVYQRIPHREPLAPGRPALLESDTVSSST